MTYRNIIFFITDRQFGRKALFMNIYVYERKKNYYIKKHILLMKKWETLTVRDISLIRKGFAHFPE